MRPLLALAIFVIATASNAATIEAGVAQVDITPGYPVRLSGFGMRRAESEGVTQRIGAKALAFGDPQEGPAILVTVDNVGVSDEIVQEVAGRLARSIQLRRERFCVTATHTHTAPMLRHVCATLFGVPIPPEHQANIDRYTREFTDKLDGSSGSGCTFKARGCRASLRPGGLRPDLERPWCRLEPYDHCRHSIGPSDGPAAVGTP